MSATHPVTIGVQLLQNDLNVRRPRDLESNLRAGKVELHGVCRCCLRAADVHDAGVGGGCRDSQPPAVGVVVAAVARVERVAEHSTIVCVVGVDERQHKQQRGEQLQQLPPAHD